MKLKPPKATIDFETRSACDLLTAGAYVYANHATTQVLCLAYKLGDGPTRLWHREHSRANIEQSPFPQDLADWIAAGKTVEAHNAGFELYVWNAAFRREFPEFPVLFQDNMLCSAAKAAQYSLPRSLEGACDAMRTRRRKNMDGKSIMLRVSRPKSPVTEDMLTKVEMGLLAVNDLPWNEDPNDLRSTWAYCVDDVEAEHSLSESLRDMRPREIEFWRMDQRMNARGVQCDVAGATMALELATAAADELNGRLREITGGAVPKGSSRIKLRKWANDNGFPILNTQADHIEEMLLALKGKVHPIIVEAMAICMDVNRTSTSKYKQMLAQVGEDGRIRDMMLYYGAARTGRWSGKGVQPHNFLRGFSKEMELAWHWIMKADSEVLTLLFGSAMKALSKATRGALIAAPGRDLIVADYAAIEARTLLWLAEDHEGLGIFHRDEDTYLVMAADIYADSPEHAEFCRLVGEYKANPRDKDLLGRIKKKFPLERQLGKKAILGLGYQMGAEKFDDECQAEGIDMPRKFFGKVVKTYREVSFPLVASLWTDTEDAAVGAIQNPGRQYDVRMVSYKMSGNFLHCRLPSGRLLAYHFPTVSMSRTITWQAVSDKTGKEATIRVRVKPSETMGASYKRAQINARLGQKTIKDPKDFDVQDKPSIFFSGQDQKTKQYIRIPTYGGSLVENNNQATARDFLAEAMLRCDLAPEARDYDMLLSVHDELIAEVDKDKGDVEEFEALMASDPDWVRPDYRCPIKAEGWRGERYRK